MTNNKGLGLLEFIFALIIYPLIGILTLLLAIVEMLICKVDKWIRG